MQKQYIRFLFVLLPFSLFGYGQEEVNSFTQQYGHIAVQQMIEFDIPASIILAQAFLESKHGTSQLARTHNNFFGIKSRSNWEGSSVVMKSAEYKHNKRFVKKSAFRKYDYPEDSWRDHSAFLSSGNRYRKLFEKGSFDYKGWARGLQKAGYATDPKYAKKLIGLIERHHFNDFDRVAFKLSHDMPINPKSVYAGNYDAVLVIQSIYVQQAKNESEKELLAQEAREKRFITEKVEFEPEVKEAELEDTKFYVFLSEDTKPIIKEIETSVIYKMKTR